MTTASRAADHLCSILSRCRPEGEAELLARFASARDGGAFAELLARHGPMVLGLCRRVLGDAHDAEDAFQATFLTLAQKAASIRRPESLAAWLHGTAFRLALRLRRRADARRGRESRATTRTPPSPLDELSARELLTVLDEELQRLPEVHRLPLVLCSLEGLSQEEAARRLGCSPDSVKGRLQRGRAQLRQRLARRGLALPAVLAAPLLAGATAPVPATLSGPTLAAVTGKGTSPAVAALAGGLVRDAALARLKGACAALLMAGVLGAGAGLLALGPPAASPPPGEKAAAPPGGKRTDLHGDPLPEGAVMRLGTLQRRAVRAKLAFSADGKTIIGVRAGKYVRVWDADSGKLRATRELPADGWYISELSPDATLLVTDTATGEGLSVWDVQTGKLVRRLDFKGPRHIMPAAFSPDGKRLAAVGSADNRHFVRAWDVASGKEIFAKDVRNNVSTDQVAFTHDGGRLLASFTSVEEGMYCWDVATGRLLWQNKTFSPSSMVFTADGKILGSAQQQPALDAATGRPAEGVALPPLEWDNKLTLAPDGRTLLVAGAGGALVWDLAKGKEVRTLAGAGEQLVVAPDGKSVVTNSGALQRWDLATGRPLYADNGGDGHADEVTAVVFSADGKRLASGARDGTVRLWDTTAGRPLHVWRGHEARRPVRVWRWEKAGVQALDMTPDGRRVVSAGSEGRLKVWDAVAGKELRTIPLAGEGDLVTFHLRISPDGREAVALYGAEGFAFGPGGGPEPTHTLATWDLTTGALVRRHAVELTSSRSSALSPGGASLVSKASLTDPRTGKSWARLEGVGEYNMEPRAFSADGLLVVGGFARETRKDGGVTTVGPDGLRVWEVATGKVVAALKTKSWVAQPAFHPDSRYLVTNDLDGVQVWDAATGKVVLARAMPEQVRASTTGGTFASCLAFTPDGRRLATGHPDSTILLWDVALPPRRPAPAAAKETEALWADLASDDPARAWRAAWRMADIPAQAVPLLRKHLKAALPAPEEVTRPLLADLDGKSFRRREDAVKRLKELGTAAEPALRKALAGGPSLEQRQRIEALLAALIVPSAESSPASLREVRAVAALRLMNVPAARRVLEELARGIPSAPTTRLARAALGAH